MEQVLFDPTRVDSIPEFNCDDALANLQELIDGYPDQSCGTNVAQDAQSYSEQSHQYCADLGLLSDASNNCHPSCTPPATRSAFDTAGGHVEGMMTTQRTEVVLDADSTTALSASPSPVFLDAEPASADSMGGEGTEAALGPWQPLPGFAIAVATEPEQSGEHWSAVDPFQQPRYAELLSDETSPGTKHRVISSEHLVTLTVEDRYAIRAKSRSSGRSFNVAIPDPDDPQTGNDSRNTSEKIEFTARCFSDNGYNQVIEWSISLGPGMSITFLPKGQTDPDIQTISDLGKKKGTVGKKRAKVLPDGTEVRAIESFPISFGGDGGCLDWDSKSGLAIRYS